MLINIPYDRAKAVAYANTWAYRRNPAYFNFNGLGGDCTNFVSQCIYAGCGVMNFTPDLGWYYRSPDDRAAAWTGVEYLFNFLTSNEGPGPYASESLITAMRPGDVIQLGDNNLDFYHTLFVTRTGLIPNAANIQVATHSMDVNCRPLNTYEIINIRYLHIEGARIEQ